MLSLEELEPEPLADGVLELLELGALLEPLLAPLPLVAPLPELDLSALLSALDELLLDGLLEELGGVAAELDELEPDGVLGVVAEPDAEELDGDDGVVVAPEPEDEDDAGRSGPRSQPPIRVAPSARETATAKVENFMWPPWLG